MMAQYNLLVTLFFICAVASASLDGTSTVATAGEEKELGGRIRSPAMMVTDRGTFYGGSGTQDNNDREGTLTRHLRNVGGKVLQDDVGSTSNNPTEETLIDGDEDSRELNGSVPLHDDGLLPTERDINVKRDNADSLFKRGNDKSLDSPRDIHRDSRNDKIEQEGGKERRTKLGVYDTILQERVKQLENRVTASASEEQVSGEKRGEQEHKKSQKHRK